MEDPNQQTPQNEVGSEKNFYENIDPRLWKDGKGF